MRKSNTYIPPKESLPWYKEEEYTVDYFCKHFGQLVNQGITFCNINALAKYKCDENCPLREPYTMTVKTASARTI